MSQSSKVDERLGAWYLTVAGQRVRIDRIYPWTRCVDVKTESGPATFASDKIDWSKRQEMAPDEVEHWRKVQGLS